MSEKASPFVRKLAIDFSETEQEVIKANAGDKLTVQVLCKDETATAVIYSGMTHLTLLERRIDGEYVSGQTMTFNDIIDTLGQKQDNLPAQLGNEGKFLRTNGKNVYWDTAARITIVDWE